jgi:pyruvate kinase
MMTKTTIVATLGPASSTQEIISRFMENGVSVFRLNFSHSTPETAELLLGMIREAEKSFPHAIAVMGDLCGPKIRIGAIQPEGTILSEGQTVLITDDPSDTAPDRFCTNTPQVISDVCVGQRLLINDGAIVLRVEDKQAGLLRCRVIVGGAISSHKGLNLPDTDLGLPAITDQDWEWIAWAIRHELDYLALSFVRTAEEIRSLKKYLEKQGSPIKVVAKIEKLQAIENLEPIIRETDAVMVARGDLGVEMDLSEVPLVQKNITRLCRTHGKPVIVATQVLQSMIDNSFPTRAEVSDIANAVMDFADAVMLSGESAVGKYPLEAVKTIHTVCGKTEAFLEKTPFIRPKMESLPTYQQIEAIARSIAQMLDEVPCELIVAATESGTTASLLSKARIHVPILALCPTQSIARKLSLHYGILSVFCGPITRTSEFTEKAETIILKNQWASPGGQILLVIGRNLLPQQNTYAIIFHTLQGS